MRGKLGWALLWLVVAAAVVVPYLRAYTHLSPFDELVHVDYLVQAGDLDLVQGGEKVGQTAMREQACRGHDLEDLELPECGSDPYDPESFPERGFNTAYPDPPVYYGLTGFAAQAVAALPGVESIVSAARGVGVAWLAAGLLATFVLSRRLGAASVPALGAGLMVAATPVVAHASATVTSDAPALLCGAVLCLVALEVTRGRVGWGWLFPAAAAALAIKATALTVVGLVVLFLLLHGRKGGARSAVRGAAAAVLGALTSIVGWAVVTSATALGTEDQIPMRTTFAADSIGWPEISENVIQLLSPVQNGYRPPDLTNDTMGLLAALFNLLLVVGVAACAWLGAPDQDSSTMATATFVAMLVSAPVLVVLIHLGSGSYVPIPHRYGLSLVAPAAACLAVVASRRPAGGPVLVGLGLASVGALLAETL